MTRAVTAYDPAQMGDAPAVINTALDGLAGRAGAAPGDVDAGSCTAVAAAMLFDVADAMQALTAQVTLIADNMTVAGSVYESTDGAVRDAVQRAGQGRP